MVSVLNHHESHSSHKHSTSHHATTKPNHGSPTKRQRANKPGSVTASNASSGLFKTELCRSYMETRQCRYGPRCQYAHGTAELRKVQRHPKYKSELCRSFHSTGTCPYGVRCRFIHNPLVDNAKALLADECTTPRTAAVESAVLETLDAPVTADELNGSLDIIAATAVRLPLSQVEALTPSRLPRLAVFEKLTEMAPPTPPCRSATLAPPPGLTPSSSTDSLADRHDSDPLDVIEQRLESWGSLSPPRSASTSPSASDDE